MSTSFVLLLCRHQTNIIYIKSMQFNKRLADCSIFYFSIEVENLIEWFKIQLEWFVNAFFHRDSKYSILKNLWLHSIVDCSYGSKPREHSKHIKEIWQEFLHLLFYYLDTPRAYFYLYYDTLCILRNPMCVIRNYKVSND